MLCADPLTDLGDVMKKFTAITSAALTAAALLFPATAAQAVCANQAIWTQDGDTGLVKKWSTEGDLLATIDAGISSSDMAISSDLSSFLALEGTDLASWDSTTGEPGSSNAVSGDGFGGGGAGLGVISGGKILSDDGNTIYMIDLTTFAAVDWADLNDADASVDAGLRGTEWGVAGDLLQLPDNDILAVAENGTVYADGVILVRIDRDTPTTVTAVGVVASDVEVWGAARAGDDIFLATETGDLLKVDSIPPTASLDPVATTEIVTGEGSFWGAAGSNDSTEGNATCELAETGVDAGAFGIAAIALIAAGGIAVAVRRRKA